MTTPFGGSFTHTDQHSLEVLSPALTAALTQVFERPFTRVERIGDDAAQLVLYSPDPQGLSYDTDLSSATPLLEAGLAQPEILRCLAKVARCLVVLHEHGVIHGDLRPELVVTNFSKQVSLLTPSHASLPGAVLRARLNPGTASPEIVSYAAPEVLTATEVTPASDVFALAAITYAALTRRAPMGRSNVHTYELGHQGALARLVASALDESAAVRPAMPVLARALDDAAERAAQAQPTLASAYRGQAPSYVTEAAPTTPPQATSPVLALTLALGGLITFVGAVMLVSVGWSLTDGLARAALLGVMACGAWGLGALAQRYKLAPAVIAARAVSCIFATVALGVTFLQLDNPGRLVLLIALSAGAWVGGIVVERRGAPIASKVLLGLGSQLLWTVGAQLIHMSTAFEITGHIAVLSACVAGVTYALTLWRREPSYASIAAFDFAVFACALGAWLSSGTAMGPAYFTLAVAVFYAALAGVATRRTPESLGWPFALGSGFFGVVSAGIGLYVMDHHGRYGMLGAAWPYGVALAMAVCTLANRPLAWVAGFVAMGIVVFVPTLEALMLDTPLSTAFAVLVGATVIATALRSGTLRRNNDARFDLLLAGLGGVIAAPDLRMMAALSRISDVSESTMQLNWALVAIPSAALVATGFSVTGTVSRTNHRALEIAGIVPLLALLTFQTLCDTHSIVYALIALGVSAIALVYGLSARRAAVLVSGSAALLINFWIQYFVRLESLFPVSVRMVGFGVGLLVAGVLYEQQLKPRVARLKDWR
jgi:hypothetical protein